jgi:hypothetical protein
MCGSGSSCLQMRYEGYGQFTLTNNSGQGDISCCMPPIVSKRDGKIVYNRTIKVIDKVYWRNSKNPERHYFNIVQYFPASRSAPIFYISSLLMWRRSHRTEVLILHLDLLTTHKSWRDSPLLIEAVLFSQLLLCLLGLDEETVSVVRELFIFRTLSVSRTT